MSWNSLTAAEQDTLLRRPFDHFARYRLAAEIITATAGPEARVLDLGGGPGSLQAFMPDADVVATDMVVPGKWFETAPRLVVADGAALPFPDDAFDVVVSLDTLEHVVPASRTSFLNEAARVARSWAFVVCPFNTPGVADADTALRAYVANRFAPDLPTIAILDEHLGYGHPDLEGSAAMLAEHGPVGVIPSGRLDRWFAGMVTFFHLLALGDDEPVEVTQRFLNRALYEADLVAPAYRHGLLVRTDADDTRSPQSIVGPLRDRAESHELVDADLGLLRVALTESLVDSTTKANREAAAARDQVQGLRDRVAQAEEAGRQSHEHAEGLVRERAEDAERIAVLEAQLSELTAFRDRVVNHPVMRVRDVARRLLNRQA